MTDQPGTPVLKTLIVDDEPLAIERLQVICADMAAVDIVGAASDGEEALQLVEDLSPDLVLLDMTMPGMDGLSVAERLARRDPAPAVIFVTAHENFAVEAFDLEAIDYVLKPVTPDRLGRAVDRAVARSQERGAAPDGSDAGGHRWLRELWVPHRSELRRIPTQDVWRIDAERDYVRLHVGTHSYLMLQTIAGLEEKLDPDAFIRVHRSTILSRAAITGLRHEGMGVWCAELDQCDAVRIGRTYLARVKAMAGR